MMRPNPLFAAALLSPIAFGACGDDDSASPLDVPSTYSFESKFVPGQSSVRYDGQIFRHVLLVEMKAFIGSLTTAIDTGALAPADTGDLVGALDSYFRFDAATTGSVALRLTTEPGAVQATFDDFGSTASIVEKIAGNDSATDHKDFKGTAFRGWADSTIAANGGDIARPEGLVTAFFGALERAAIDRVNGSSSVDGAGNTLPVHVTAAGLDLNELINKFATCAVAFHQGSDDYLDDDVAGKGLLSSNAAPADGGAYTALEHAWDEGFGYFGGARDYLSYSDEELAAKGGRDGWKRGYYDSDQDGAIDLFTEYNFGHSTNAAKRDIGTNTGGETDMTRRAVDGFLKGRAIIANAAGRDLTEVEMAALKAARDEAIGAWEEAISATSVHYINDTLAALTPASAEAFNHQTLAKAWSELKGFALCPQFNPRSPVTATQFDRIHTLIGDAPVLPSAGAEAVDAYKAKLREARDIFMQAYTFPAANRGGDNGEEGW